MLTCTSYRYHSTYFPLWYGTRGSFLLTKSDDYFRSRRTNSIKMLSLNAISEYVPIMLESCDEVLQKWKVGQPINFSFQNKEIAFNVICKILFGSDAFRADELIEYTPLDTYQTQKMTLGDVHCRLAMDISMIVGDPLSRIFPFIKGTTLLEPYKSLYNNMNNIYTALRKMCDDSKDEK